MYLAMWRRRSDSLKASLREPSKASGRSAVELPSIKMVLRLFLAVTFAALAVTSAQAKLHRDIPDTFSSIASCVDEPLTYSCENTAPIKNTCCSPTPGGLVLQTQFWSTWTGLERKGQLLPEKSWTIHGLWPDNCDGCVHISLCHVFGLNLDT